MRNDRLPAAIVDVARVILAAVRRHAPGGLREQADYALALVASGRVPRESGVQRALIDVLVDAGADPNGAMAPTVAHREREGVERLLEHGAEMSLLAAACTGRRDLVRDLAAKASADERQIALAGAASGATTPLRPTNYPWAYEFHVRIRTGAFCGWARS